MEAVSDGKVESGMGKLIEALSKAQAMFEAPKNLKTGQQGNRRFKYAPLDEIIRATRDALAANGLAITTYLESRDTTLFVTSELRLAGCDACITSRYPLTAGLLTQERGKEITYGRRYNRCALLDVVGEDSDTDDGEDTEQAEAEAKRKEAEKALDELKNKGRVRSAYDGKVLAPGRATLPAQRAGNVETLDQRPKTIDKGNGAGNSKERGAPGAEEGKENRKPEDRSQKTEGRVAAHSAPPTGNEGAGGGNLKSEISEGRNDEFAGIATRLAELMRKAQITPAELKAYYVGKGHLPDTVEPSALPADYVAGLTRPDNWKKAVAAMKGK